VPRPVPAPTLDLLLPSWLLTLRADRKSTATIKTYGDGARYYLAWCAEQGVEPLSRSSLRAWTTALLDGGNQPATARSRQLAVRRFASWLTEEGELAADPFMGIKLPKLDTTVVQPLTEDELRALLKACIPPKGLAPAQVLRYRRDEAVLRLMLETGARAGEVVALALADLDLPDGTAIIRKGKGGKGRVVPFGASTAQAIDRYLRLRRSHRLAESPALWLGDRGQGLLLRRATQDAGAARRGGGDRRVSPAPDAAHRRAPLAGRRRLRGRPDGRRRMDPPGHADALHQGAGVQPCRRGGPRAQPGGSVSRQRMVVVVCVMRKCNRELGALWTPGGPRRPGSSVGVFCASSSAGADTASEWRVPADYSGEVGVNVCADHFGRKDKPGTVAVGRELSNDELDGFIRRAVTTWEPGGEITVEHRLRVSARCEEFRAHVEKYYATRRRQYMAL